MVTGGELPGLLSTLGLDPTWSRRLRVPVDGAPVVHVLDRPATPVPGTAPASPRPTVVCLHGNPTWSVLWAPLLRSLDPTYRVVAPDQVDMGMSDRVTPPGSVRRFATRVDDLDATLAALDVSGPVVLIGHDWGGAVAMGWAVAHPDRVAGLVLANTGIAVPEGRRAPWLIRLAARRAVLPLVAQRTPLFALAATRLPGTRLSPELRHALAAPYRTAQRRGGIAGFVADVPFDEQHPSAAALAAVADGLGRVQCPVLLLCGARDPVFDDTFVHDLARRLPQAEVHREPRVGHLSPAAPGFADVVQRWLAGAPVRPPAPTPPEDPAPPVRAWTMLERRAHDEAVAFHDGATGRSVTFAELCRQVTATATALHRLGVRPGDRVGILVPPGVELVTAVYACWRLGAVTVIADRGLGIRGLGAALRSARVRAVVGVPRALRAAHLARWAPGARFVDITRLGLDEVSGVAIPEPPQDAPAAVLFTSGATGPAKGVCYTHRQLEAQRDALMAAYRITAADALVAAFAPFVLYGPAMGITSALPDVDVTAPATLTAAALDRACAAVDATLVFASPAALANVVATAASAPTTSLRRVRTVMSAGAPIPVALLREVARLAPSATLHTPYGMTEVLPVADVDLETLDAVGEGRGVCVGAPVAGCRVVIAETADAGVRLRPVGATGEVLVAAPWCSAGYDVLADTQRRARPVAIDPESGAEVVWHRSGDLGHLDDAGRLWIEGRVVHAISTSRGVVTPVPLEVCAQQLAEVGRAAAVGVGPPGVQQVVVIVEPAPAARRRRRFAGIRRRRRPTMHLATYPMAVAVRGAVTAAFPEVTVAAVLEVEAMPVDVRHNAKIDRTLLAARAEAFLAGRR